MPIPDFQSAMFPALKKMEDGNERHVSELRSSLAQYFNVTEEEQEIMLPSGVQKVFYNRVAWAITHLKMAELIESNRRSWYKITRNGQELLRNNIDRIDLSVLRNIKAYSEKRDSWASSTEQREEQVQTNSDTQTPDELLENGFLKIRSELGEEILSNIKNCTPKYFERLVLDVLLKLGYGGSEQNRATLLGKTGDDGVDGLINEDKLGLDVIYIQAKRWEQQVGQPEIQKFAGALLHIPVKTATHSGNNLPE